MYSPAFVNPSNSGCEQSDKLMVFHIQLSSVTATNAAYWTAPASNPPVGAELLAYVDYVGQALLQQVSFTVNGNPLDSYTDEVMNFHQKLNTIDLVYIKV